MPRCFSLKISKQTSTITLTQYDPPFEKSWLRLWLMVMSLAMLIYDDVDT